jgi:putative Mn2+ efflux pump MntP
MTLVELFVIALGLSMDAFAASICKGLATSDVKNRHMVITGLWFGGFQALMPLIGYFVGATFKEYIDKYDHWIALVLLSFIGINMIREALFGKDEETCCSFCPKAMLPMAIGTSIDALIVGVTFALLPDVSIGAAVSFIGVITFLLSAIGVKVGNLFGAKYKSRAELIGGIILVLMGVKIVLEHLEVISF